MVPNDGSIDGSDRPRPGHSQNHSTDFSVSMQKPPRNSPFTEARSNRLRQELLKVEIAAINQKTKDMMRNDAKFKFHQQTFLLTKKSLGCIDSTNKLRRCLVWLVTWRWFENAILLCILLNTIVLMVYDYRAFHFNLPSARNDFVENSGYFFTGVFTLEFLLKTLALGFIMHRNAYLRDPWNWLDFIVVVTGLLEFVPGIPNLKPLRVLRVFRPLRSIKTIESMRRLVSSLLKSLPKLGNVIVFLIFLFLLFGILGLQLFGKKQYNRCRTTPEPVNGVWELDDTGEVCRTGSYGYFQCPAGTYCGNPEPHGISLRTDGVPDNDTINYGITNFDNILAAMLTIFQMITLEGWTGMMYNLQDAMIPFVPAIYFCFLVVLGSFFLLNLILAVIMDSFEEIDSEKRKTKEEERKNNPPDESADSSPQELKNLQRKRHRSATRANKKPSLAAITSEENEGDTQQDQPSFMNSTNTAMIRGISMPRQDTSMMEEIEQIHQAIPDRRGEVSFCERDFELNIGIGHEAARNQAQPKSGDHTLPSELETDMRRRTDADLPPLGSQSTDQDGLNQQAWRVSKQRARSRNNLRFSVSLQNEKAQSSSHQHNLERSVATINFHPDPEPEPQLEIDTKGVRRFSRRVQRRVTPLTPVSRSPRPAANQATGRLSHESRDFTDRRSKRPEELIEIDDIKLSDRSHNFTRDEQFYSDQQIHTTPEEQEHEEEVGAQQGRYQGERGSSIESDSQNDPGERSQEIPAWSKRSKCLLCTYRLVKHPLFNFLVLMAILANTVVLALDRHPIPKQEFQALENANLALYCFFLVEMILKLIGMGWKGYTSDSFNIFDGVIVVLSTIEIIVSLSFPGSFVGEGGALSAFRGFRLLRVFKIARSWTSFQGLLRKIGETLKDIWSFVILLLIVIFCFSMMGMEFFSYGAFFKYYDANQLTNSGDPQGTAPRLNFNNLLNSVILIFVVLSGEDWQVIMYDYYRHYGVSAAIFFVALVVIGNFIFLNLFLAILLKDFEDPENFTKKQTEATEQEEMATQEKEQIKKQVKAKRKSFSWRTISSKLKSIFSRKKKNTNRAVARSSTSKGLITPRGRSRQTTSSLEIRQAASKRFSLEETYTTSSPSPPGHNSDTRKLRRGRLSSTEQDQANSQEFSIIPIQISAVKYSSLAGNSDEQQPQLREESKSQDFLPTAPRDETKFANALGNNVGTHLSGLNMPLNKNIVSPGGVRRGSLFNKKENAEQQEEDDFMQYLKEESLDKRIHGRSLFLCKPDNKFRLCVAKTVVHKVFEGVIIVLILASSISLAIENPLDDPNGQKAYTLYVFDAVLTAIFCLEAALKIIAFGFLCGTKHAYLRNCGNVIDFTIVIVSIISLAVSSSGAKALKALRLLRVLRPVRVISKNEGLRLGVQSLIMSVPDIVNVFIISLLFFLVFGIFSVNYFKGAFHYCELANVDITNKVVYGDNTPPAGDIVAQSLEAQYFQESTITVIDQSSCLQANGTWFNRDTNFDNALNAIMLLFEMSTTEGWVDVMYWGIEARGPDKAPKKNNAPLWGIYFIIIFVVGSLFIINLFVGVVIRKFQEMKEILGKDFLLTSSQKQWIEMRLMAFRFQPKRRIQQTLPTCRRKLYKFTSSNGFEWFIMICIIINTALMAITWYGEPPEVNNILESLNYVFAVIFTVEAVLKITALGKMYFKDGWNWFDFIIVCGTLISILIAQVSNFDIGTQATLVRSFRIGRIFRLIRRAKSLKMIFDTFIITIPSLTNVGAILLLLIYIYAVLGVNLFATVSLQDQLNRHANFQSFGTAFLTLMRVSTGEAWNSIMHDTVRQRSEHFDCLYNPTYSDIQANGGEPNGCGNNFGYFYFCSFVIIVSFVYLNLFIAIILQGFSDTNERANLKINEQVYEDFREKWSLYDREGKGLIETKELPEFILGLGPPLGIPSEVKADRIIASEWLGNLKIKSYQDFKYFHFWEVLQALVRETLIREKAKDAVIAAREKAIAQGHQNHGDLMDEAQMSQELQQQILILEENANNSNEARIWRNLIKAQKKVNKRLSKHKPDQCGSEFIWAARVILQFFRRRIMSRKMMNTYKRLRREEAPSTHGEDVGSISFEEVEFTNMVRNASANSVSARSAAKSVLTIPVHPTTPLSSDARRLPYFNESWDSEQHRSGNMASPSPQAKDLSISAAATRQLQQVRANALSRKQPPSPQRREMHLDFASRQGLSPPTAPGALLHSPRFGAQERRPSSAHRFPEETKPGQPRKQGAETPPPLSEDRSMQPSLLGHSLGHNPDSMLPYEDPHERQISFGDEERLGSRVGWTDPRDLRKEESLPPSMHDTAMDESKQGSDL